MRPLLFLFCCFHFLSAHGQKVYLKDSSYILFSGCMEAYFSYDFTSGYALEKPDFIVNYKRNREVNINFGMVKANYSTSNTRINFGMMLGNYVQYNLATESNFVRNIYEANIGFKLTDKKNWWLDAGIMPSHIGFESLLCMDNKILTKSMAAENTPYYETGVRLSYTDKTEKWYVSFLMLNGWQRIGRNGPLGFGMQLAYKASKQFDLNYSNYIGKMNGDELRVFNNFYFNWKPSKKVNFVGGVDLGLQKLVASYGKPRIWISPQVVVQYKWTDRLQASARLEYYADTAAVVIQFKNFSGVKLLASSLNLDYKINSFVFMRNEIKWMACDKNIFYDKQNPESRANDYSFTSALVFQF